MQSSSGRRRNAYLVGLELAESENDAASLTEAGSEVTALQKSIDELEVRTLLSGEYDEREAIVQLSAGAGGVGAEGRPGAWAQSGRPGSPLRATVPLVAGIFAMPWTVVSNRSWNWVARRVVHGSPESATISSAAHFDAK